MTKITTNLVKNLCGWYTGTIEAKIKINVTNSRVLENYLLTHAHNVLINTIHIYTNLVMDMLNESSKSTNSVSKVRLMALAVLFLKVAAYKKM